MQGKVLFFNDRRGFGFIEDQNGQHYFAHFSHIEGDGYRVLTKNELVVFEPVDAPKGPLATKIRRMSKKPDRTEYAVAQPKNVEHRRMP